MRHQDPRERLEAFVARLPQPLVEHIHQVRRQARALARRFHQDEGRADLAALAHDIARATPGEELRRLARGYRLAVHPVEEALPVLLHGPVGVAWLRRRFHLHDPEVHAAVRWHSTAQRGLTPLAKVVFLADKLDPEKERRYPYLEEVRQLAQENLDAALLAFLEHELRSFLRRRALIHPATLEARNELLRALPSQDPRLLASWQRASVDAL